MNRRYTKPPVRTGTNQYGPRLSPAKISRIKKLLDANMKQNAIAKEIGCTQSMVSHVKHGRRG